jgi:hypothetical protein
MSQLEYYPTGYRRGRWARLDPLVPSDYELIAAVESEPPNDILYRNMGLTPSPQAFGDSLWSGVIVQFMVRSLNGDGPAGLVACYAADFRHSHASIAVHVFPGYQRKGWPLEALPIFVNYLFFCFSFRKLYADVVDVNAMSMTGPLARDLLSVEATLKDHYFLGGEYHDRITFAIHRDTWTKGRFWPPRSNVVD